MTWGSALKRQIAFGPMADPGDREGLTTVLARSFGVSSTAWDAYFTRVGPENFRVVRGESGIAGGLAIYFMGQWFGGRVVPMAGIAAVGVAPELRGTGVAFELMARTLGELHASGIPLSTLYASTQKLYRKVGFEQAGIRCQYVLRTRLIQVEDRSLQFKPIDPSDHQVFHDLYRQRAMRSSGHLERNRAIWERTVLPRDGEKPVHAYLAEDGGGPQGYVIFLQPERELGYELLIRDVVALTPQAARGMLTFFADHRSMGKEVMWCGPLADPLTCLLPEQDHRVKNMERWMLRIVDVPKALAMRGYPEGVDGELHLEVWDDVVSMNQGRWVLRVNGGRGEVAPGGRGDMKLAVAGLASLYSRFLTAHELAAIGFLAAPPAALAAAARLFAGPEPWMPDFF
jgi:predicted acetyltransferase